VALAEVLLRERSSPIVKSEWVSVPGGRVGEVVGFYRRAQEAVVVLFSSGKTEEFLTADVELFATMSK
jgi:hypothetical protein